MSNHNGRKEYPVNDYQNDLVGVLRIFYKRKVLIISGIVIFCLVALILSYILPKEYCSEGFFQFSDPSKEQSNVIFSVASQLLESSKLLVFSQLKDLGMLDVLKDFYIEFEEPPHFFIVTIQDFKKYSSSYNNFQKFLEFVKVNKFLNEKEFSYLSSLIKNPGQFSKYTSEIYALSRDDLKNVGQTLLQEKNYVVGLDMEFITNQRERAQRFLKILGDFIRFCIFYEKINEYATASLNEFKTLVAKYDNYILNNQSILSQLVKKREELNRLYKKYPAFSRIDSRQVIELGDVGQRYLSLTTQIVGIESRIIDIENLVESFKGEKQRCELFCEFFRGFKKRLDQPHFNGEQIFKEAENFKGTFLSGKDQKDPIIRTVTNSINIGLEKFNMLYYKTLRFVSGPSLPLKPQWPRKSIFLITGFFLGVILFIFIALILEFWNRHKGLIKSEN
jgi:hypothetical protein